MTGAVREVSVVIRTYTENRWENLVAAVASAKCQTLPPREIVVVVDHNARLLERVHAHIPGVVVVENNAPPGASSSLNTGIAATKSAVIAFLDDDAVAAPDWLERLVDAYEDPRVLGAGGMLEPAWEVGRPNWFPEEFDWVVGCTYRGMPQRTAPVPRLVGANMSFRREVLESLGGFRSGVGAVGNSLVKCEDTEFSIRVYQQWPEHRLLYEPRAKVYHRVPATRARWSYFRSRCFAEGHAKVLVRRLVGAREGLGPEWSYTIRTLPLGVVRHLVDAVLHRDPSGLVRAGAIMVGLAFTMAGYLVGEVLLRCLMRRQTHAGSIAVGEAVSQ